MSDCTTLVESLVAASRGRLQELLATTGKASGDSLVEQAQANIRARLRERSSALVNSVRHEIEVEGDTLTIRLLAGGDWQGLRVPYARLQEFGGHVLPVHGKYLAIPIDQGLTAIGTAKYASVRQLPFAAFRPLKKGKARWLVFDRRNGDAYFVLVTDAVIPEKRFLRDAVDAEMQVLPGRLAAAAAATLVGGA